MRAIGRPFLARAHAWALMLAALLICLSPGAGFAQGDTTLVYGPTLFENTSGSSTIWVFLDDEFTTTPVPGRRYLIEVSNSGIRGRISINGQEWIGETELRPNVSKLIREFTNISASTGISVALKGASWVDVRIAHVADPTFKVYGVQTFVRPATLGVTDTATFSLPAAADSLYRLHVINGQGNGANRVTNCVIKINGTQVMSSTDFGTGVASVTRQVTLLSNNTLTILNQSASGSLIKVWLTARDTTPPVLYISAPADQTLTTLSKAYVTGTVTDETAGILTVNGQTGIAVPGAFSDSVALAVDGKHLMAVHVVNAAGLATDSSRTAIRDTRAPTLTISQPPATPDSTTSDTLTVTGSWVDSTWTTITVDGDTAASGASGSISWKYPLDLGSNRIQIKAVDALGHSTTLMRFIMRKASDEPSARHWDPGAPALSATAITQFFEANKFLYTAGSPLQTGVTTESLRTDQVAVVRGWVIARDLGALPNVAVSVLDRPEFGSTVTRSDGAFDMMVNGGGPLTMVFTKPGYLSGQRRVTPTWLEYANADTFAMIGKTAKRTVVDSAGTSMARGRFVADGNGEREVRMLFPRGFVSTIKTAADESVMVSRARVRATEFTIGRDGPKSMPAPLPAGSAYTYCVDLRLDEADSLAQLAGKPSLDTRFNKPIACYVRNLLHLPVGTPVPAGYYDEASGMWKAGKDGVILKVIGVSVTGDSAVIDTRGTGTADPQTRLDSLGVTGEELMSVRAQYAVGDTLWRVTVDHFSIWDFNFNLMQLVANLSNAAGRALQRLWMLARKCLFKSSIIECENRVLGQRFPLIGTPFTINYRSFRAPGDEASRTLRIPITGDSVSPELRKIVVQVDVAGRRLPEQAIEGPDENQVVTIVWDGLDAYGRRVQGSTPARIGVGYLYDVWLARTDGRDSFNDPAATNSQAGAATGDRGIMRTVWSRQTVSLGVAGTGSDGLGGWTLSPHHLYDNTGQGAVYFGDGSILLGDQLRPTVTHFMGGDCQFNRGAALPNTAINPAGIVLASDGSLLIADNCRGAIMRVTRAGVVQQLAGMDVPGHYSGDGAATSTPLEGLTALALAADGSIYFSSWPQDEHRAMVGRVTPAGMIEKIVGAGGDVHNGSGDRGPANQGSITTPTSIAVGPDGSVFIGEGDDYKVRRIAPNGIITTYAGTGTSGNSDSTGKAISIRLSNIASLAVDDEGNLYIAEHEKFRIRRVAPDGHLSTFVTGGADFKPYNMAFAPDGAMLITSDVGLYELATHRIWRRELDGTLGVIAGGGIGTQDGTPALAAAIGSPRSLVSTPDGTTYVASGASIKRISRTLATRSVNEVSIPRPDGSETYFFSIAGDSVGRHLRTRDAMTGAIRYRFGYDAAGRLIHVRDQSGLSTTIVRDGSGTPLSIVGPFGQTTEIDLDGSGHLSGLTDPHGRTLAFTTSSDGLLGAFTDAVGHVHTYDYASDGRLERDREPTSAGGSQLLEASFDDNVRTVTRKTAMVRTTTYEVTDLGEGTRQRRITDARGLLTYESDSTDAQVHGWSPEGVASVDSAGPDRRFGMTAPVPRRNRVILPSGKKRLVDVTRSMDAGYDPPFVAGIWQQDVSVNSRTPFHTEFHSEPDSLILRTESPLKRTSKTVVDSAGRPREVAIPGLATAYHAYDDRGRVIHTLEGSRAWRYAYDVKSRLESVTDTLGRRSTFSYDNANQLTSTTLPDTQTVSFAYDPNGNLISVTPPGRPAHDFAFTPINLQQRYAPPQVGSDSAATRYTYNTDGQLTRALRPDSVAVDFTYHSSSGRLSSFTIPRGSFGYSYESAGQLDAVSSPDTVSLSYSYDGPLPLTETWSGRLGSHVIEQTYDDDFRPLTQDVDNAAEITLRYDLDGLLAGVGIDSLYRLSANGLLDSTALYGLNATSRQDYNAHGELANLHYTWSGGTFLESMARDPLGRITSRREVVGADTARVYDYIYTTAGRLRQVKRGSNVLEHYEYDVNGNRTFAAWASASGTDTASATYDAQDRLTRYRNIAYTYTRAGELARKVEGSDTTHYSYDPLGQLITVVLPGPSHDRIDYLIDGHQRRVGKKLNGRLVQGWLYQDELQVVAELDSTGAVTARYVYGSRSHVPDYLVRGGNTYRLITDQLGSVRLVVNASTGAVAESLAYDAYGRVRADTSPGWISLGYAGGLYDPQTSLVRFGARDYDPRVGRWTARDPIRFAGGDPNLFAYVGGDPVNLIDPSGTSADDDLDNMAGVADFLSCGGASKLRDRFFSYNSISQSSAAYGKGWHAGQDIALGMALGGAGKLGTAAGEFAIARGGKWSTEILTRTAKGGDGATSRHIIEKLNGKTASVTHQVFHEGKIIHQHQTHVGKYGTRRQFPDEWVDHPSVGSGK